VGQAKGARVLEGLERLPRIVGYDIDEEVLKIAMGNLRRAGLESKVTIERRDVASLSPPGGTKIPGLLVVNPPYGERMGGKDDLRLLYANLGQSLKEQFTGWRAVIFTGDPDLAKETGLKAHKKHVLYNGSIRCELLHFQIHGDTEAAP